MVHQVWIGPLPAGRLPDAVEMDQQVVARRRLKNRFRKFDGLLIVMVKKIDHHSAPAHLLKGRERFFHSPAQSGLMHPRP